MPTNHVIFGATLGSNDTNNVGQMATVLPLIILLLCSHVIGPH